MVCGECGTESPSGQKFCGECGAPLVAACPSCGSENLPANNFCGECGSALAEGAAAPEVTGPASSAAVDEPSQERRVVTVLFADLCGFTTFSESRDPEQVRDLLTRYFEASSEIIERFGGIVDKFIGDAVMGVWGAVTSSEDDAERAVRAGLDLVEAAAKLGADAGIDDLQLRVGALTGEAAVGPGANDRGLIIGDMVNTASRLHSIAPPGSVVVGETTYRLCDQAITFEPLGEQALKGKSLPTPAWRALRVAGMRGGDRRSEGVEAPFVGRDEELRLLKDQLYATARDKRSRLVSITGIAGIGKSRLIWELRKYVDGLVDDVYWHAGRSPAYGEGIAFWALAEMVRERARIAETDDDETTAAKLAAMLEQHVIAEEERAWMEPRLAGLLGLSEMPVGERGELFSAFRRLFERIAERGTTILAFEDLQWADTALLDFVEELIEWSRDRPILVVTAARPELLERRPTWGAGHRSFVSVHLGPLAPESTRELLAGLVTGLPQDALELLEARAEGIPLYAIELVRMLLLDERVVYDEDGRARIVGDLSELMIPESLHAVIGARLDRLERDDRSLVADAAVLGQTFTVEALAALSGRPVEELSERLSGLVRRELLTFDRDPRSPERGQYGFVQGLIREVAYARLSRQDRRERHLAIARHFGADGDVELLPIVADHYLTAVRAIPEVEDAALHEETIAALRRAADRSATLHAHEQVLAYSDSALELADGDAPEWWERAALAAHALARADLAEEYAERLVAWQRETSDRSGLLRAQHLHGRILVESFQSDRAVELLTPIAEEADDGPDGTAIVALLARSLMLTGASTEAAEAAERALVAAERLDLLPVIADALITRGTVLGDVGRPREAIALLKAALEIARRERIVQAELRASGNLTYLLLEEDPAFTRRVITDALELARNLGERVWIIHLTHFLLVQLQIAGELDAAEQVLDDIDQNNLSDVLRAGFTTQRAILAAHRGAFATAHDLLADAAAAREADTDFQRRAHWYVDQSFVALMTGDAEHAYELAMRSIKEAGPGGPGAYVMASRAALLTGDREQLEEIRDAIDEFPRRSRLLGALRGAVSAGIAVLDGDGVRASQELDEARRHWDADAVLLRGTTLLAFGRLAAGRHPDADEATREGTEILERTGATGFLAAYPAKVDD